MLAHLKRSIELICVWKVHWVQCDKCELWYHLFCIGLKPHNIKEDEDFCCRSNNQHHPWVWGICSGIANNRKERVASQEAGAIWTPISWIFLDSHPVTSFTFLSICSLHISALCRTLFRWFATSWPNLFLQYFPCFAFCLLSVNDQKTPLRCNGTATVHFFYPVTNFPQQMSVVFQRNMSPSFSPLGQYLVLWSSIWLGYRKDSLQFQVLFIIIVS